MSESVRYHIAVSGRVQGVGYRFFVIDEANKRALNGWVRNLPDGRVEAEVEGPEAAVKEFVGQLKVGPRLAHVTDIAAELMEASVPYHDFRIR